MVGLNLSDFRQWEAALPAYRPKKNTKSALFLAPTLPEIPSTPEISIYDQLVDDQSSEEGEFRWWEEDTFRATQSQREASTISAARTEVENLLKSLEGALQAEKARELETQRAAQMEAKAKAEAAEKAREVAASAAAHLKAVATPSRPVELEASNQSGIAVLAQKTAELGTWGSEARKSSALAKELWKESALATATIAGNETSVKTAAEKLTGILGRCGPADAQVRSWLGLVMAEKIVGSSSVHNKSAIWASAYVVRLVGGKFPDFPSSQLAGCLARRSPWVLSHSDVALRQSFTTLVSDQACKESEAQVRLWLAVLAVSGDERGLTVWLRGILVRAQENEAVMAAIATPMKLFAFLDTAAFDYLRLQPTGAPAAGPGAGAGAGGETLLEQTRTLLARMKTLQKGATFSYYVEAALNVFASAAPPTRWPVPEGLALGAAKEAELDPNL